MMKLDLTGIIGWTGSLLFVAAYLLLSTGKIKAETITYHGLNALGGACLVTYAGILLDLPNLFVNLVWLMIACFSIVRLKAIGK